MSGVQAAGHLVIIGGGLRPENRIIYDRMVEYAGGAKKAKFVILPTASSMLLGAQEFQADLELYGVERTRAEILDVTEANAAQSTSDPRIIDRVRNASGVYIAGGDQRRLVRALTTPTGSDTPLLAELRLLFERGGVIGGTSAGASGQSAAMLSVSGLPDTLLDEGFDALDFGITTHEQPRGLLLRSGLGFFKAGVIDQHFNQFRGRLGRLTRATAESGLPYGFGIDENTALIVQPSGELEVLGAGFVTIVATREAEASDSRFGYLIKKAGVSLLSDGDRFDPVTGVCLVPTEKQRLPTAVPDYQGNFLITDIAGSGAIPLALVNGLAENSRTKQEGICLKYSGDHTHGYHFTFRKVDRTEAYGGYFRHAWTNTLLHAEFDIVPIARGIHSSATRAPLDLPSGDAGSAIAAVEFRGIMPADSSRHFHPRSPITRGEFGLALARSLHLAAPYPSAPTLRDVDVETREGDELMRVVAAGLMPLHTDGCFAPTQPLTGVDAAASLVTLANRYQPHPDDTLLQSIRSLEKLPQGNVTREQVAIQLQRILKLPMH